MFQLERDTLDTKNFEIATVVKKLQMFEVGRISKIREIPISPFWSATMISMVCYNLKMSTLRVPQIFMIIFSESTSSKKVKNEVLAL